jgi:fumarate reductase subunit C
MDNNVKSYRKPYVRPVKANWWTDRAFYIAYMLREGTSIFGLLVALECFAIIWAIAIGGLSGIGFAMKLVSNPIVVIINIISLVSVMYHAYTWFNLMPLVVRVFKSNAPTETKLIPAKPMVIALWGCWVVACIVIGLVLALIK